jgi:hypothetical protein
MWSEREGAWLSDQAFTLRLDASVNGQEALCGPKCGAFGFLFALRTVELR